MTTKSKHEIQLPPCGIFIGNGIYPMSKDYLLSTLHAHQAWMPQSFSQQEMIDKIIDDNQGNLAQLWGNARGYAASTIAEWQYALDEIGINVPEPDWEKETNLKASECAAIQNHPERNGAGILRFIRKAAEKDIYTLLIYVDANQEWVDQFQDVGTYYLGYDFGERYTFRLDEASIAGKKLEDVTLKMLGDDLVDRVRQHVDERHAAGWGNVMATSGNFYIDYEIAAGTDVPLIEDFAFAHLNVGSALSRGLYRQFNLPTWGTHMAHEHYSWIPNSSEHKWNLLKAAMYQKYMSGCKIIINESGNWFVEATLCEDSPKHEFPRVPLKPSEVDWGGAQPIKFIPYIKEAQKYFSRIDHTAPVPRRYRKEISDFYDFVKENGTPEGQPESTVAIAKGNYDLCSQRFSPQYAIGGAYALADKNPAWFEGVPERGWEIVKRVFYPTPNVIDPYENPFLSGTPFGQVDIVSFVQDKIDARFLNTNYKALLFAGWNTSSEKQYQILKNYVADGGTLFISIPQLSTNIKRNFGDYGVEELVNGGDFSELCGVKVLSRGERIYWATAPDNNSELGFEFPRRFGILATPMGNIEITDPNIEVLAVDDEQASPLVLRHKLGKGEVYFLNSWAYPGAFEQDFGPGSTRYSPGLVGYIYRHIANKLRGTIWITDDKNVPGMECEYINFSYFPESQQICLYNIDFGTSHTFYLHQEDKTEKIELSPGEFKLLQK
ncbi:MAG: hypothetical protein ABI210_12415 [Abditibacteriaceae bacterium]